jgi:TrmH family RNA methyltransferase
MITSRDNSKLKDLKKLQEKRFRLRRNQFAAEGEDLVAAALAQGWEPETIFCSADAPAEFTEHPRALGVEKHLLADACALGSGARVVGVFPQAWDAEQSDTNDPLFGEGWQLLENADDDLPDLSLHLEGVADPGNIGTLLRSAAAFADGRVSLGPDCADPYSPKALRAAMGATFAKPPTHWPTRSADTTVIALDGRGDVDIREIDPASPIVLCAGGEREGLGERILENADIVARIEMLPGTESLNVAMATTIALFELSSKLQSTVHGTARNTGPDGNTPSAEK